MNLPDDLEIDTGIGHDEVNITGDTRVGDDLEIKTYEGDDSVVVTTTTTGVADDATIETGDGNNSVTIIGPFGTDGDLKIKTGKGNDSVEINSLVTSFDTFVPTIAGDTTIETGDGDDEFRVSSSTFLHSFRADGGEGTDTFTDDRSSFAEAPDLKKFETSRRIRQSFGRPHGD